MGLTECFERAGLVVILISVLRSRDVGGEGEVIGDDTAKVVMKVQGHTREGRCRTENLDSAQVQSIDQTHLR